MATIFMFPISIQRHTILTYLPDRGEQLVYDVLLVQRAVELVDAGETSEAMQIVPTGCHHHHLGNDRIQSPLRAELHRQSLEVQRSCFADFVDYNGRGIKSDHTENTRISLPVSTSQPMHREKSLASKNSRPS